MSTLQVFKQNTAGRDFVVGDIHGCFDQLQEVLSLRNFNPDRDRIFAVGDLVDRGKYSVLALEWLEKPWFHSCLGNHEEMVLTSPLNWNDMLLWVQLNGGAWWFEIDHETQQRITKIFSRLPYLMEVETALGRVGIVHADVPVNMSWQQFVHAIENKDSEALHIALWGRDRAEEVITTSMAGIDRIVCGHTITADRQSHVVGNVWFIDTGAFLQEEGSHLTILEVTELFAE